MVEAGVNKKYHPGCNRPFPAVVLVYVSSLAKRAAAEKKVLYDGNLGLKAVVIEEQTQTKY